MHSDIHILAACTDRKRLLVPSRLKLRSVGKGRVNDRAQSWRRKLENDCGNSCQANELYAGDHWANIRRLVEMVEEKGFNLHTWVISAGYGLLPFDARIHPYSATFADYSSDSVIRGVSDVDSRKDVLQSWWQKVCAVKVAGSKKPSSIAALARKSPKSIFIIIASPSYLLALEKDLLSTLKLLKNPSQLIIISSHSSVLESRLEKHVVPSVESLQSIVGGTLASLHARVATLIFENVEKWGLSADKLRARLIKLAARGRVIRKHDRKRVSDDEVKQFITARIKRSPRLSCSALLQQLRDRGRACEQSRFKNLFWSLKEESNAS